MSERRPSARRRATTERLSSLRFDPLASSERIEPRRRASARAPRPTKETQRLTPLQADLLGEVRSVRGRSARIGPRLPLQGVVEPASAARARSRSISVRLVAAVSARLAHPLQSVTREERFLARWTLALSAISAPLAMLSFTLLVGLELPRRRAAAEGAAARRVAADPIAPELVARAEDRAPTRSRPAAPPQDALVAAEPEAFAPVRGGGALAAAATRDRVRQGHEPGATLPAGFRPGRAPEQVALEQGGAVAWVGTAGATRDGARRVPLQLLATDRSWRELTLLVELPAAWRVREVRPGQALYEAGAELESTRRAGGLSLHLVRPAGAELVGDGEVAVVLVDGAGAGAVEVRVQAPGAAEAVAHVSERRLVLD